MTSQEFLRNILQSYKEYFNIKDAIINSINTTTGSSEETKLEINCCNEDNIYLKEFLITLPVYVDIDSVKEEVEKLNVRST